MGASFSSAAEIAATQHGQITTEQLKACDFSRRAVGRAVEAGRLHRVHIGVFALGYPATDRLATWHGDVLACGDAAVLSVRCAATLLGIRDGVGPRTDVTIPPDSHRRRPGIAIHRAALLDVERTECSGIPVTSPARTIVDLAHHLRERDAVEWAMREMQFRRLFDRDLVELSNSRRPSRLISALLDLTVPTGSPLEVAFRNRIARRHGLPDYVSQAKVCGFHVDCFWPEAMLVVEVDGKNHDEPLIRRADATVRHQWRLRHLRGVRVSTDVG